MRLTGRLGCCRLQLGVEGLSRTIPMHLEEARRCR